MQKYVASPPILLRGGGGGPITTIGKAEELLCKRLMTVVRVFILMRKVRGQILTIIRISTIKKYSWKKRECDLMCIKLHDCKIL